MNQPTPSEPPHATPPTGGGGVSWLLLLGGLIVTAGAGAAGWYVYNTQNPKPNIVSSGVGGNPPSSPEAQAATPAVPRNPDAPPVGFQMGEMSAATPIEKIRILIHAGPDGEAIQEPIDVHLGMGFPLRLYPLGTVDRGTAVVAFPQRSSLPPDTQVIAPGDVAWFEFEAQPLSDGNDPLRTSPTLLADLTVGDLQTIGFASRNQSDWVLGSYEIRINDELYASHGDVSRDTATAFESDRVQIEEMLPQIESMELELADQESFVQANDNEQNRKDLQSKQAELLEMAAPVVAAAQRMAGTRPWFVESDAQWPRSPVDGRETLTLEVLVANDQQAGSRNPLYLQFGGRKFPVDAVADPQPAKHDLQSFELTSVDRLLPQRVDDFRLGMIGADMTADRVPDRAQVQRVVLKSGADVLFDSEDSQRDRQTLQTLMLVPPAHRDENGRQVVNSESNLERFVWHPGLVLDVESGSTTATTLANLPNESATPPTTGSTRSSNTGGAAVLGGRPLPTSGTTAGTGAKPIAASTNPAVGNPVVTPIGQLPSGSKITGPLSSAGIAGGSPIGSPVPTVIFLQTPPANQLPAVSTRQNPSVASLPRLLSGLLRWLLNARQTGRNQIANQPLIGGSASGGQSSATTGGWTAPAGTLINALSGARNRAQQGNPQIEQIRFRVPSGGIVNGQPVTVQWKTTGSTLNISHYQVELYAVLPDHSNWLLPIAIARKDNVPSTTATLTPDLSRIASRLPAGADPSLLYALPLVRAIGTTGQPIGTTENGPLLPIFPAASQGVAFALQLGPTTTTAPGFQINGNGMTGNWLPFTQSVPVAGQTAVWPLLTPTGTHAGFPFDAFGSIVPSTPMSQSVFIRPKDNQEMVVVRFDTPVSTWQGDMRLIAHLGFAGNGSGNATATWDARVSVSNPQRGSEWLRLETTNSVVTQKTGSGGVFPLQRIDVPIRWGAARANYDQELATTPYQIVSDTSSTGSPAPATAVVSVTLMVTLDNPLLRQASSALRNQEGVGVFSVRIVPASRISSGGSSVAGTGSTTTSSVLTAAEKQAYVAAHNSARSESAVNVPPVQWSDVLAADAQRWADELARRDIPMNSNVDRHRNRRVPPTDISFLTYGENLFWGTGRTWTALDAVKSWYDEKTEYVKASPDPTKATGHYTQMVWQTTTEVGYGRAVSATGQVFVVGTYNPPGNVQGSFPYPGAPRPIQ